MSCIAEELFNQMDFPKKLLLLGSGESRGPSEFYSIPSIRFNLKTFAQEEYNNTPVFGNVINRMKPTRKKAFEIRNGQPYFILQCDTKHRITIYNKAVNFYRLSCDDDILDTNFGNWFKEKNMILSSVRKRATTGFFASVFLLHSPAKEYYVAGFDGFRDTIHNQWGVDYFTHNYNLEYEFLLEAIDIAREKGKKVYLAQDFISE